MKKALFRFSVSTKNKNGEQGSLILEVPMSSTKDVEPEIKISQAVRFEPLKENEELLKLVSTLKFNIRIYSDYKIINKNEYADFFDVAMNKDKPNELTISPVNRSDEITLKPIKILEDWLIKAARYSSSFLKSI